MLNYKMKLKCSTKLLFVKKIHEKGTLIICIEITIIHKMCKDLQLKLK